MMKNSCFTLDVPRFLGLFEASPVIFSWHLICNGLSFPLVRGKVVEFHEIWVATR